MAALGWLLNLDFAAGGVTVRYGAYIDGLSISRSGDVAAVIDAAGYVDGGQVLRSGDADAEIERSGSIDGGRVRRSGSADISIEP